MALHSLHGLVAVKFKFYWGVNPLKGVGGMDDDSDLEVYGGVGAYKSKV